MKKETKMLLKRFVVMLAVVSLVFSNIPSTWTNIFAATKSVQPVLEQTSYREMLVGNTYDFDVTGIQRGAVCEWSSSNKEVATVTQKGLVKAVTVGTATITCKITKNNKQTLIKATVVVRKASKKPATRIKMNNKITSMKLGDTYDLNYTYSPKNASDYINWSSSNTRVATVDKDGIVIAKAKGTVTIKASALNSLASDKVVIKITAKTAVTPTPTITVSPTPTLTPTPTVTSTPSVPSTPSTPSTPTTAPTTAPTTTPKPSTEPTSAPSPEPTKVPVNDKGLDSKGRMVAYFGSPAIDGDIDTVWDKAVPVSPTISSGATDTTATFKTLWDDKALYILAEVKDSALDATSATVYERDSIEVFMDENNDKTKDYNADDLQFRVNYKNVQSADHGDLDRFYTSTKVVDGGYIVEGRVALQNIPANEKVLGIEFSINDAQGGKRIATMNVFDKTGTAYGDTSLFGNVLLAGKTDGAASGLNPYDLLILVKNAKMIKLERYSNGAVVQGLISEAESAIGNDTRTQKELDDLYISLKQAVKDLKHLDQGFDDKECRQIPYEYKTVDDSKGSIERVDYKTSTYDPKDMRELNKYLNVYLPRGYNPEDKTKKYNVLYLIHGMGEDQNTVFGGPGKNTELMKIVDNMIANGQLEPMIIVTPTWQVEGSSLSMFDLVKNFHNELINDILPAVESRYNVYAASTKTADLIAARNHRAFAGFSMGGGCTWYNYIYCLDYFRDFMPISLWCLQDMTGMGYEGTNDEQKAKFLADVAKKAGYGPDDFNIFCATGTDDMAYGGMVSQIEAMKNIKDTFVYTADLSKGNFYFLTLEGGTHTWNCVNRYLYNMLPDLFRASSLVKPVVDENGFDSSNRMVAEFGTPVIDGEVDDVWNKAISVNPKFSSAAADTKATFKALWDDNALYVLATVKDSNMSVASGTPYMQDGMEIFLDENNDKTQEYGVDDLHLRVNYENYQSVDAGSADRFYAQAKKIEGGYQIEARVALNALPSNAKVMGIDLQINDAVGTDRVGTINVFDSTGSAWNDTRKFGEVVLAGKGKGSVSGINPYNLLNLIKSTTKLHMEDYTNPEILVDAIKDAQDVLAKSDVTQEQIDAQFTAVKTAISMLILTGDAANEKYFTPVPDSYKAEATNQGSIVSLSYNAPNTTGGTDLKNMNVYLPYGYNPEDTEKKYNVLYLMHGGGEDENTIFGGPGQNKELKKIIDNMIANGNIEPLIVVTPTTNAGCNDVATFYQEFVDYVMPLVETTYHTYAASGSLADLKASREHRAFGGFSMGSVCTWYTYMNCLDYVKYYLPISGDCWALGSSAGSSKSTETAQLLADVAKNSGYTPFDYYLFCATGAADIAYPNLKPQVDAMKLLTDYFKYSSDKTKGNFYFIVSPDGTHAWNWVNQYIYDILPDLFQMIEG